jgi:hypothetical protein
MAGRSGDPSMALVLEHLFEAMMVEGVELSARYINTKENCVADAGSRLQLTLLTSLIASLHHRTTRFIEAPTQRLFAVVERAVAAKSSSATT